MQQGVLLYATRRQVYKKHRPTISSFFKNYLLAKVRYLPIRFSKTKSFLRNTKNTYRNGENEQITHDTRHADRKMTRVG